jgi:class 3 adenylate cyclase
MFIHGALCYRAHDPADTIASEAVYTGRGVAPYDYTPRQLCSSGVYESGFANSWTGFFNMSLQLLEQSRKYWGSIRFGESESLNGPLMGLVTYLRGEHENVTCGPEDEIRYYTDWDAARRCLSLDLMFGLIGPTMRSLMAPALRGQRAFAFGVDPIYSSIFDMFQQPLREQLFEPLVDGLLEDITRDVATQEASIWPIVIPLAVASLLVEIVVFLRFHLIDQQIKQVLGLLMHVSAQTLNSTPKIVRTLGGDWREARGDMASRDQLFFDAVFSALPDAILFAHQGSQKIQGANESCKRLFGNVELSERNVREAVRGRKFAGDLAPIWDPPATVTVSVNIDGGEVFFEVTSSAEHDFLILSFVDVTQTVRHRALMADETARAETLLKSILPPSLVGRVQAGETGISFSVQSASFSFTDIVEFTPWCGRTAAPDVMKTLNLLFNFFDEEIAARGTLMREKCIGDCYVAAGGIFSEENQPTVHAREMCSFGLAAIASIGKVNKLLGDTLRCRVGVNTGGPLVAGVLGGSKPTFEILGPAINMAQQMEHHGVPMCVHISRAVYELIYGDVFEVKEKGQTEVKKGTVVTYLITGVKAAASQASPARITPSASQQRVLPPPPPRIARAQSDGNDTSPLITALDG